MFFKRFGPISYPERRVWCENSFFDTNLTRRIDPHGPEGLRISKVSISGKYNLWLSPGAWPTGGLLLLRKHAFGVKNDVCCVKVTNLKLIWVLPIAYCLLPIAYCLLPIANCLLPIAYCLLPVAYCTFVHLAWHCGLPGASPPGDRSLIVLRCSF